jgi:hypothetical protein
MSKILEKVRKTESSDPTPAGQPLEMTPREVVEREIVAENRKATFPTLLVELPSRGLLYPEDNPLSRGVVEMKYMTAKEEDILTTESYIKQGVVLDKLFQSMIVSKIDYDTMLTGDKNAIMIAARIYGYGEKYESKITTPSGETQKVLIDLNDLKHKEFDESLITPGQNRFSFRTPISQHLIEFKLLTNGDQKAIEEKLKKYRKPGQRDMQLTTRLCQMILAVDGNSDPNFIRLFVDNDLLAPDSRALREYINKVSPDVDMSIEMVDETTGEPFLGTVTAGLDFFWPDARI